MKYFNETKNSGSKVVVLRFDATGWNNNHKNSLKASYNHKPAPVDNP